MNSEKIRYFIPKIKNRFAVEKNRLWQHVNVERVASWGFIPFKGKEAFAGRLMGILGTFNKGLFEGVCKDDRDAIIVSANQALHHDFYLLGSGCVHLDPIDWHVDFITGKRWEKKFYRELSFIPGADIKVPWELSRCQHLLWLGEAYLLTDDEKYAKEVVDEINWWIDDNPLMYSVNWKCAMDVAFRAVNWMFALNMIVRYEGFDEAFASKVSKSLWQHAFFIWNNLEKQIPFSNNHYASDIVGLLYIGALFKNTKRGRKWYKFALNEYYKEILTQVLPSGVHYERSVSYHRLMTELFSYPAYMLQRTGEIIPKDILGRLRGMYKYVATYTKPNGLAPLIADNDDGRFVPPMKRDFRIHNYLNDSKSVENRIVTAGSEPMFCASSDGERLYADAGVAIINKDDVYLYINNGGYSKRPKETDIRIGTHTHNDLLSFELCLNGNDVLTDAGTYLYMSSITDRNEFRSTAKHNTVVVDGEEQNDYEDAFTLIRNVLVGKLVYFADKMYEGRYSTVSGQMNHVRRFEFKSDDLIITDTIHKVGSDHEAKLYYHFAEGITAEIKDNTIITDNKVLISFDAPPDNISVVDDSISPSFGVMVKTSTGVVTFKFDNHLIITTTIKNIA